MYSIWNYTFSLIYNLNFNYTQIHCSYIILSCKYVKNNTYDIQRVLFIPEYIIYVYKFLKMVT